MPNWTDEQLNAINKAGSNIIVSAGAGSGKTTVLAERVIQKIKKGIKIDSLLILTFTNAASHEMKERIRENLIKNNLLEALEKLDNTYITTFDSYALSIVKKYHYLLNINKNISICDSSIIKLKKMKIMDEVFLNMYSEQKFQELIDGFCIKDDKNIKNEILELNEKLDMIYDKNTYLNEYINMYYNDEVIDTNISNYLELFKSKINNLKDLVKDLSFYLDIEYINKVNNTLLILDKDYDEISFMNIPPLPKKSCDEAKSIKSKIDKLYKEIKEMHNYNSINEIKQSILKTKNNVETIIKIINEYDIKLSAYKQEFDLYEFTDIAKLLITLVKNNEAVKNELNYSEILIDEYQDTNDLQETFISYIENNNVYMVGDIKQSIYRFRNANPSLFKYKYDNYNLENGGIKIDLNKNFRSRIEVVDNINIMFNLIMDDLIGGADYKKYHQMIFGNQDYLSIGKKEENSNMEVLLYDDNKEFTKDEIEAFTIVSSIKEKMTTMKVFDKETKKLRNIKYSDFTILMDRATKFDLYKKIFEYSGIPLTLYKDEKLNDSIELYLIKNIICFFTTKDNLLKKYSFMSIIRSYLFKLDDDIIFKYITNNDYSYLDEYLTDVSNMTPFEITEYIINKFAFYKNIIKIGDIKNREDVLNYLLNLSLDLTNMGYDIESYYNYLNEILDNNIEIKYSKNLIENDSVKIMTIHKSKGLEYPVCYYTGLTNKFNISELNDYICYDKNLGIIVPIIDNGIRNTIYKDLFKNNYYNEEISEKVRLFYVALTRAKEKMIMVLPNKDVDNNKLDYNKKIGYRSFADMIYSIFDYLNDYKVYIDLNSININKNYNMIKKINYQDSINLVNDKILKSDIKINTDLIKEERFSKYSNKVYSTEEYKSIEFGKHMHSVFENFDFLNPNYEGLNELEKLKINKFLNLNIFNNVKDIYKEYEFIYEENDTVLHGFIDLLVEYDDSFVIIDYKLKNISDDAYLNQLKGYKSYIESISNKKVKTYLYSILDDKLKEV